MMDAESPKPLYEQIKEYLLYKINTGEFSPHSRIPSERNLSQQFGVSRLTVSKAIKELIQAGKLYTQVGKGTFVDEEIIDQQLNTLTGFTEEMHKRGQRAASQVLRAEIIAASDPLARRLEIPVGGQVLILKRVRLANRQPVAVETSHVVADICPRILDNHDFSQDSLYHVLRTACKLNLTHAEQTIVARGASEAEASILGIETGQPILNMTRVTFEAHARPVEFVESAYRGDRYTFRAKLQQI